MEKDRLALALKGASEALRELFFKNLTERAAKLLRDDIAALGPVRLRDVDEAQAAIVVLAKDMAAQGQLTLQGRARRGDGGVSASGEWSGGLALLVRRPAARRGAARGAALRRQPADRRLRRAPGADFG